MITQLSLICALPRKKNATLITRMSLRERKGFLRGEEVFLGRGGFLRGEDPFPKRRSNK